MLNQLPILHAPYIDVLHLDRTFGLELEEFLSHGMDQQEADDKHHRAGYAMN